ncbi:hypothetical protein Q3G72_008736 [Acer saccharum]|nr:hypothetical protein Q3G72_008736 [Acer saccharum]
MSSVVSACFPSSLPPLKQASHSFSLAGDIPPRPRMLCWHTLAWMCEATDIEEQPVAEYVGMEARGNRDQKAPAIQVILEHFKLSRLANMQFRVWHPPSKCSVLDCLPGAPVQISSFSQQLV